MGKPVSWSELPTELWSMIGKKLDTHMDVCRFRSVCSSWRSLIPPVPEFEQGTGGPLIGQRTVYLLEPPPTSPRDSQCPPSPREGWLIKIAEKEYLGGGGRVQLFNPLSSRPISLKGGTFPKVLCTMDYRVTEIFVEHYFIRELGVRYPWEVRKVIVLPDSPWAVLEETLVVGIFWEGRLMCWKHGDEDWTELESPNCQYDDLIAYKGQCYVVDRFGIVSWIDPSFKIVQFSPPVCGDGIGGDRKHLVELGGDLHVVDRYFVKESKFFRRIREDAEGAAGFKVHRLNQEWGKWDEVRNLGDVAIFLGDYSCFSVSVKGFGGCKGNCVYFTEIDGTCEGNVQVFNMEDRSIRWASRSPDHLRILWPPPAWIAPNGFALSPRSLKEADGLVNSAECL
ncbi:hypothetical protein EUGRSUZ_J02497 [Eucalyptus grandis]|uniref:F-box domain-containing protein n=2 Tax=Eucalyptus grandis TaxID=71139 RepID=A0A059AIJ8_EUCGR|nr:hypothetical protein EUGRSUZ_J02497 [Eucalyptus grandis]